MSLFEVRLLIVEEPVFSGEISMLTVQTLDGELGVLRGHIPLFAALQPASALSLVTAEGEKRIAAVTSGFVSVTPTLTTVLAESIVWVDDLSSVDLSQYTENSDEYILALALSKAKAKIAEIKA